MNVSSVGDGYRRMEIKLTKRVGAKSPLRLYSELSTQMIVDSKTMLDGKGGCDDGSGMFEE